MSYRLVWLCTDIIEELTEKYDKGYMDLDNDKVFELFQCEGCEAMRIAEAEGLEENSVVDLDRAKRTAYFKANVEEFKREFGER